MLFEAIGSLFGGGSSSSSSVTSNVNLTIKGLDNMKTATTLKVEPLTVNANIDLKPVEIKPLTVNSNIDLKPVKIDETIELKPVKIDETIELKPVEVKETFDLRPVAVDTCQTMRLAPLPETRICQPYRHHVAYTMFGMEWSGVSYDGESQQLIESPRRPRVVEGLPSMPHRRKSVPAKVVKSRGIRVRVLDPDE